ncbi:MAG: nucleoside hydrolase [Bacteroidales bacterium]|nr:nucleoside hydrolase [Bacteroidales bacterium]
MKHIFAFAVALSALVVGATACSRDNVSRSKVIVDTDMVEGFDDGIALAMLLRSGADVLGVTTVTGNTWAREGAAYALRQAELFCPDTVPTIIVGSEYPLREGRLETLPGEIAANPGADSGWLGSCSYARVTDWKAHYEARYGCEPSAYKVVEEDASDFIIRQLHQYPGEVTLLAIGPCTNIAKALQKDPSVASLAKEIVYMGGAFWCEGNSTAFSEFNILYDPEAAAICFRAPFPLQTVVSLDVCNTVLMDSARYMSLYDKLPDERMKDVFRGGFHYPAFKDTPGMKIPVWDLISAAIVLDKSVVTKSNLCPVDVIDNPASPEYGRTVVSSSAPRPSACIPLAINEDKFWKLVNFTVSQ